MHNLGLVYLAFLKKSMFNCSLRLVALNSYDHTQGPKSSYKNLLRKEGGSTEPYGRNTDSSGINEILYGSRPERCLSAHEAAGARSECIRLSEAAGCIAADYISLYPPGIPVLVPGERISGKMAGALKCALERGLNVKGITDDKEIRVYG